MSRLVVGTLALLLAPAAQAAAIGSWGVDLSDQDRSVRPGDDFFRYQNGGWVARAAPDVQHPFMSYWRDVRSVAPARLRAILDALAADASLSRKAPTGKAALLYRDYLDEAAIEKLGHAPLKPQLSEILAIRSREDAARVMGRMEGPLKLRASNLRDGSTQGLFTLTIGQDPGNPRRNTLIVGQGGIGLPDPSYYSAAEVADVRAKYQDYVASILKLIGWPAPDRQARSIVAFETTVAKASTPLEQLVDPARAYHPISYGELKRLAPRFAWDAFFAGAGMKPPARLVIDDPQALAAIAAAFAATDLKTIRARQAFAAADYDASLLSHDLYAAKVGFRTNVLNSASLASRDRKDGAERLVEAVVPDVLGSIYVARFVPPEVDNGAKAMGEALSLKLWVNDELRQDANTRDLIVDIPAMIEIASRVATLHPGDIIATGTPEGVGPVKRGDRVRIAVEHCGEMSLEVR